MQDKPSRGVAWRGVAWRGVAWRGNEMRYVHRARPWGEVFPTSVTSRPTKTFLSSKDRRVNKIYEFIYSTTHSYIQEPRKGWPAQRTLKNGQRRVDSPARPAMFAGVTR